MMMLYQFQNTQPTIEAKVDVSRAPGMLYGGGPNPKPLSSSFAADALLCHKKNVISSLVEGPGKSVDSHDPRTPLNRYICFRLP